MKHRRISQRLRLFLYYGTFTIAALALFFLYIYRFNCRNMLDESSVKQANICASVRDSVKTELDDMSTISLNLVYSSAIRENFISLAAKTGKVTQDPKDVLHSYDNAEAIFDVITAMIGSYQTVPQVNLYTMDGTRVSSGYQQGVSQVNLRKQPWYDAVMSLQGSKYISPPTIRQNLPATGPNRSAHEFFSMTRLFFNEKGRPEGMFEVVQDCNAVFSLASDMEETNAGLHLYVYDDRKNPVYPYAGPTAETDYLGLIRKNNLPEEKGRMLSVPGGSDQFVTWKTVPQYGWTVVAAESEDTVYSSLPAFRSSFFLLTAIALLGSLAVCSVLARQVTRPLSRLTRAIKKLTMHSVLAESTPAPTLTDSSIAEISDLCSSFLNMHEQLRKSSRDLLLARSEEMRANLQATQSLVNPHFLYNSLTCMGALAEDGEDETITRMCGALCDYFRYIADTRRTLVPLREELDCTKKYIECMQIRFGEAFSYSCEIAPEAERIRIPKLIVQPIIENAFKYAFAGAQPWKLNVRAEADESGWRIRVEDNGGRLTGQKREELLRGLRQMDREQELRHTGIGGMGLKNVYLRLTLQYGDRAVFDIDCGRAGRTVFLIGGPIQKGEDHEGATDL